VKDERYPHITVHDILTVQNTKNGQVMAG